MLIKCSNSARRGVLIFSNTIMEDIDFEKIIESALEELPEEFKEKMENVSVVMQDWPSISQGERQIKRGERGLLLGLYEGVPKTRRGYYGIGGQLPDKITIFKIPILMISQEPSDIRKNVYETVVHEIAHHFGMSDQEIHDAKNS
jgi:predicted Zn-dependent protease with MMP-like domain